VNYILDKGKGSCLGSLFTIKLLECDLHFGLKWAFTWQLGSFAEKHQLYNDYQHTLPGKWHHVPTINKPEEFNNGLKIKKRVNLGKVYGSVPYMTWTANPDPAVQIKWLRICDIVHTCCDI
jgi:hypothetical protein